MLIVFLHTNFVYYKKIIFFLNRCRTSQHTKRHKSRAVIIFRQRWRRMFSRTSRANPSNAIAIFIVDVHSLCTFARFINHRSTMDRGIGDVNETSVQLAIALCKLFYNEVSFSFKRPTFAWDGRCFSKTLGIISVLRYGVEKSPWRRISAVFFLMVFRPFTTTERANCLLVVID